MIRDYLLVFRIFAGWSFTIAMAWWAMFISLIYISRCRSRQAVEKAQLDELVAGWAERNAALGVRGALLVTNHHLAQILEGPDEAVDRLMADIRRDPRHERVTVIERRPIDGYRFTDWCFAYWGTATYMDQKVAAVLEKQDAMNRTGETVELFDLMRLLARESHVRHGPIGNLPPH